MVQKLSDIKGMLSVRGLHPKKKFGQNFLHDHNHMKRIMAAAEIGEGDVVLEVGPGTGALTEWLLEAGAEVVMVEIDRDMEDILLEQLAAWEGKWQLYVGSALKSKHEIADEVGELLGGREFKMIANLPYNVASPLLANLAVGYEQMKGAVVMIQKEVADRLTAEPGGKTYGALGIVVQAMCEVEEVSFLSGGCFWPPPRVGSSVVSLKRRAEPLTADAGRFSAFLQKVFSKRRKQLGGVLSRDFDGWPEGVSGEMRCGELSVAQLEALSVAWTRFEAENGADDGAIG
ncbi:Ribosomal RNA adenine dimethylase [Poriferisphaera corsica]|uniref:Ribosomal RNA small subunit methyltransferase A n=1 Tax=Poriferisphaera corsica TaxID=2528020 RepID=A0A517YRE4_9BACT|nr:16S rRNA (adenine(1518)-N(6)/adenine(1519)-N(6))-dimethyltransferase RsmA [Poriferisphaera corsica]QDU32780.1 Ribosomal RNA adenine dimethylase [Poriferisphaera corsica]